MLLKLLIYLEGNWENICKTRGDGLSFVKSRKIEMSINKIYLIYQIYSN